MTVDARPSAVSNIEPATIDEATIAIVAAASAGRGVRIVGGGTKSLHARDAGCTKSSNIESGGTGLPPVQAGRDARTAPVQSTGQDARAADCTMNGRDARATLLCTRRLNRVLDLSPGDLTVTVEAGITLAALDAALAEHNLRLPLDPPDHDGRATLGGVLAANDSGPLRQGHGTARDLVLGVTLVQADGTVVKAGGKVVKNVAGYDLHRLLVGSYGSLALIAAVSLKLRPRAERMALVTLLPDSSDQAETWTGEILRGTTRPAVLDWLRPAPVEWQTHLPAERRADAPIIVVGFENVPEAVERQAQALARVYQPSVIHDADASAELYARLRTRGVSLGGVTWRAAVPSGKIASAFKLLPASAALHAHAGAGALYGGLNGEPPDALDEFRGAVRRYRGWLWLADNDGRTMWDRSVAPVAEALEMRLKQRLDPDGVFPKPPFLT